MASVNGQCAVVKTLLSAGAGVNLARQDRFNSLMAASRAGHDQVAQRLLHGPDTRMSALGG